MLFLEAKWLYNHLLAQSNVFEMDYKLSAVPVKVKDMFELRQLKHLSSHMKQSLIRRTRDNIRGLARLKEEGRKIGRLKFKSSVDSIPLKQYGNTYRILNEKYLRIQGIRQHLRVNGLAQIPSGSELANATLVHRHGDYYVAITTYQAKGQNTPLPTSPPVKTVGIDFGLKTQLTLSDGIAIRYVIPLSLSKRLRRLHQQLSRQQYRSNNWFHTRRKLKKAFARLNNIKQDIKNKLVHYLQATYGIVCYQDENLKGWQRLWGGKILSTALGGLIRRLEVKVQTPIKVEMWFPSSKTCSRCGSIRDIGLEERIYVCRVCGLVMDRDLNASHNLEHEGLKQVVVPMGRRDVKPVETESSTVASLEYLNGIPYVTASSVVEAGSLTALV
jgi:putative transposase